MKLLPFCVAPLLLLSPMLFAQGYPGPDQGHGPNQPGMPYQSADREQMYLQHEQMADEREDLGELGLPTGPFWLNPALVARVRITPDQVHRLADAYLQGRLKIIQLEANEEMEEAKLDALESAPNMDNSEAVAATDRLADARAATEKADAHLAFALRAILNQEQLAVLKNGYLHPRIGPARSQSARPATNPGAQPGAQPGPAGQHSQPPA